jgi:hypothetical protein
MSIQSVPHFEVQSSELAAWMEKHGADIWWNVDGDPVLTERIAFPCPGDELAQVLRRLNRSLLIQDPQKRASAQGKILKSEDIDSLADRLGNNVQYADPKPVWADDRVFYCCWKGSDDEWLLTEDTETSKSYEQDQAALRQK